MCKHGIFLLNSYDNYISRHMQVYGEWSEVELQFFLQFINPGDVVVDVGANLGAFTVPLAKAVGPLGHVHAFEPQRLINQRLNANIALNILDNVNVYHAAVGSSSGTIMAPYLDYQVSANYGNVRLNATSDEKDSHYPVQVLTLDSIDYFNIMNGKSCPSFIKIDVEGMERDVLIGGQVTISRCKPILFVENHMFEAASALVNQIYSMDYIPYWQVTPYYNGEVFYNKIEDITDGATEVNMICFPKEMLRANGGDIIINELYIVDPNKPFIF
jgi:FkbM family methyltransferase